MFYSKGTEYREFIYIYLSRFFPPPNITRSQYTVAVTYSNDAGFRKNLRGREGSLPGDHLFRCKHSCHQ